jgi:hypothetical protein
VLAAEVKMSLGKVSDVWFTALALFVMLILIFFSGTFRRVCEPVFFSLSSNRARS